MRLYKILITVVIFSLIGSNTASADNVGNNLDGTFDPELETLNLITGGVSSVQLSIVATNGDGRNGCNFVGNKYLTVSVNTSNSLVATVSPSSITFTACTDTPSITVTAIGSGTSTISLTETANTTSGTFDLTAAVFVVNVTAPTPTPTPTSTLTPTPIPTESPEVEILTGGGGNSPAIIVFSGVAMPEAQFSLQLIGKEYGEVTITKFTTKEDGSFEEKITSPVEEQRTYGLIIRDKDGLLGKSKFFTGLFKYNRIYNYRNLVFSPTISVSKSVIARGELLLVRGHAGRGNKVSLLLNKAEKYTVKAQDDGLYEFIINTNDLAIGTYSVQVFQTSTSLNKTSDLSEARGITISPITFSNIDMNQDLVIDVRDWSIFLSKWSAGKDEFNQAIDLNGDQTLSAADFSIFLNLFQLAKRP